MGDYGSEVSAIGNEVFDKEFLRNIEKNKTRFGGLYKYLRKNQNLFADAKRVRINQNPIFKGKPRERRKIVGRSLTMVKPKEQIIQKQPQILSRKPIFDARPMAIDPILFQLQSKQTPQMLKYSVKRLKSNTLIFKSEKGQLHCSFDPEYSTQSKSRKSFSNFSHENSDQLLLSTENTLYDYYNQSIRLQNLIRKKESEKRLDWPTLSTLSNKLSTINQNIVNEHSRIARSFYTM